ncbi:MAG: hypothetical protein QNJ70_29820 [Xenococcaceae cyanobacterium MO_207.B15]|nr:hypothetical protein [Xenococcaceae cyanobacterium MO_207.B15]
MVDLQSFKIDIFTGINDEVIAPTADSGGNISHFYDKFNALIDIVQTEIDLLKSDIASIQGSQSSTPTLTSFTVTGIYANGDGNDSTGTIGAIPKTGRLKKIIGHDNESGEMGQFDTFFDIGNSSNYFTVEQYNTTPENYFEWVFSDDTSSDVTEGDILTFLIANVDGLGGLDFEVFIYG